jgi:phosphoribosylamine--glycine ligase
MLKVFDLLPPAKTINVLAMAIAATPKIRQMVIVEVIYPTVNCMTAEDNTYLSFLYASLMIMSDEMPKMIEYNCRFGDPDTQPIMMRLQSDLVELVELASDGKLNKIQAEFDTRAAVGVVLAAGGYPDKGDVIDV